MTLEEVFNPEQTAQEVTGAIYNRLQQQNIPEEDAQLTANIIFEFGKIAGSLILQDQNLQIPNTSQIIPIDYVIARQIMELFAEGVLYTILKTNQMGLPEELKTPFLQNTAQHVFEQTKNVVISTFGQEHTPELQISQAQQIQLVNQTADNALMYYIGEHEKQFGPIVYQAPSMTHYPGESAQTSEKPLSTAPPAGVPQQHQPEHAYPQNSPQPPVASGRGPNPHDKYAALALLLSALPPPARERILERFTPDERHIIGYYEDPTHIHENLELSYVLHHLNDLKAQLKQGLLLDQNNPGVGQLLALKRRYPQPMLMAMVRCERLGVQQAIQSLYAEESDDDPGLSLPNKEQDLPPKVKAVLVEHLVRLCKGGDSV